MTRINHQSHDQTSCRDRDLLHVLHCSNDDLHDATLAHIDACDRCQHRLIELAADGDSWSEAITALRDSDVFQNESNDNRPLGAFHRDGSVIIAIDAELSAEIPVQADRISLDFLDDASHPEMLGRVGRYDVERLIGAGGMGIVFKAFDSDLHRPVALKVLAPHLAHSGGARQRFAREAQSAAAVVHENVVPIHYVDTQGKLPFLVMQYVPGESLQTRVDRDGPLPVDEILQIGIQIARGLAAAHDQGLVHRDVKPGNMLLEPAVNRVLITDFGLARAADDASVTRSGIIAGTPHYMSPEQAQGKAIDSRSDLFGLGGVLYFMSAARPPFRADGAIAVLNRICSTAHRPVDEINELVPAELADLIDGLLAKKPSARPENADRVAKELSRQLKSFRAGRPRYRRRNAPFRRHWKALAAVTALAMLCVLGWQWTQRTTAPQANSNRRFDQVQVQPQALKSADQRTALPVATPDSVFQSADVDMAHELQALQDEIATYEARFLRPPDVKTLLFFDDELPRQMTAASESIIDFEQRMPSLDPPAPTVKDARLGP